MTRLATANCRRQYGRAFVRLVRRNGQYYCEFNQGGGGNQPRHTTQNSAAVIGAIGGIIGAIGNAAGNRGTGRGTRCHHRPGASTQHCGSN